MVTLKNKYNFYYKSVFVTRVNWHNGKSNIPRLREMLQRKWIVHDLLLYYMWDGLAFLATKDDRSKY